MFKDHLSIYLYFYFYAIVDTIITAVYGPQTWVVVGIGCYSFITTLMILDLYADWKSSYDRP